MAGNRFDVPVSPWTERFGAEGNNTYALTDKDGLLHSGLAPLHPRLHPKYYNFIPLKDQFTCPVNDEELDELLLTEEGQKALFMGNPSWSFPPLNSNLAWDGAPSMPGGHRIGDEQLYPQLLESYMAQRIEVDEDTWLPVFRKQRWYDLEQNHSDTVVEADGTTWNINRWTVDNERVWGVLRFSLEIANRILMTLIRDNNKWLGTYLYGRIQMHSDLYPPPTVGPMQEDYRITLDPEKEKRICEEMGKPFLGRDVEPDADKRLQFVNLLGRSVAWSFLPSTQPQRGVTSISSKKVNGKRSTVWFTRLNSNLLALLCGGTLTIAERCIIHGRQAMTVISKDELMHALHKERIESRINASRAVLNDLVIGNNAQAFAEPYVGGEPIAELGRSFEAAIFGGTPRTTPISRGGTYGVHIPILAMIVEYPSVYAIPRRGTVFDGLSVLMRGAPVKVSLIPPALFWRLQSKAFWDSTPPNGQNGFLFPDIFTNTTSTDDHTGKFTYTPVAVNPNPGNGLQYYELARKWNRQQANWSWMRPWYDSAYRTWLESPWGFTKIREKINIFRNAYEVRDEAQCATIANSLQQMAPTMKLEYFPDDGDSWLPEVGSSTGNPPMWLFHCLGLFMLAALPMRRVAHTPAARNRLTDYQRSLSMGEEFPQKLVIRDRGDKGQSIIPRAQFFSRVSGRMVRAISTRVTYIEEALDQRFFTVYMGIECRVCINKEFYKALVILSGYMHNQIEGEGLSENSWLPDFPFEPPYRPSLLIRWNPTTRSWDDVEAPGA
ncbi:hypothetical protein F4678DRAFT_474043 [Xylaria arbuscula]|nr:hypothetical protein F4678DRAFT_474043 [Xylaria arbuscula]